MADHLFAARLPHARGCGGGHQAGAGYFGAWSWWRSASKARFDPALEIAPKIKKAALQRGLMCYPMQGTIDGQHGDHVLLAPPFIVDETQVDDMVEMLKASI